MYLENLFGAEKFYQIFFGIFGNFLCLWIFFPIFFIIDFWEFFQIGQIRSTAWVQSTESKTSVFSPESRFKPFLFSSPSIAFIFRPHWVNYFVPQLRPIIYSIYIHFHYLSFSPNPLQTKTPKLFSQTLIVCTHLVDHHLVQWLLGLVLKGKGISLLERSLYHTLTTPVTFL